MSCKKEKVEEEYYIKGLVYTVPEFSYWYTDFETGEDVTVSIESSNLSTVAENGMFSFNDVSNGVFNLDFEKNNYSKLKIFDYNSKLKFGDSMTYYTGIDPSKDIFYLFEKSSTMFESDLTVEVENEQVTFYATINRPLTVSTVDSIRYFFVFIDETNDVSFDRYKYCASAIPIVYGQEVFQRINIDDLSENIDEFDYNKTYYAIAYGVTYNKGYGDGKSKYFDNDKNVWIYMGLNDTPSNIVSFSINSK